MTREEYEKIQSEHYSGIKHILESPAKYLSEKNKEQKSDPVQYAVGRLAHAMVWEGKDMRGCFAIKPKGMSFASKEGKKWRDAQTLPILKEDDSDSIPFMAEAIAENPEARDIIMLCDRRETMVESSIQGVRFKMLLDGLGKDNEGKRMVFDLKTCIDVSLREFSKCVNNFHYDLQDELYCQGVSISEGLDYRPRSGWIAVEKKAPFEVACYYPDATTIECGQLKLQVCIDRLKACQLSGKWPKQYGGLNQLIAAPWALDNARKLSDTKY